MGSGVLNWIHLAVNRDQWQPVVNIILGSLKEFSE
jgi:hypothetical protein